MKDKVPIKITGSADFEEWATGSWDFDSKTSENRSQLEEVEKITTIFVVIDKQTNKLVQGIVFRGY